LQAWGLGWLLLEGLAARDHQSGPVRRMSVVGTGADHYLDAEDSLAALPVQFASVPRVSRRRDILWSRPGAVIEFDTPLQAPAGLCAATAAVASLLFDPETRVWLSASADCKAVRAYLRLHTQSLQVAEPTLADFAIISRLGERPPLGSFHCGTDGYPKRSTTLIVQVDRIERDGSWTLTGPGLRDRQPLGVRGLGERFLSEWAWNAGLDPRGVDVILASGLLCCYLPRTTRIGIQQA
jgi:alpha-D-ribose 1-methylphosphonate 5-triphosphate synthase subunit PhnH